MVLSQAARIKALLTPRSRHPNQSRRHHEVQVRRARWLREEVLRDIHLSEVERAGARDGILLREAHRLAGIPGVLVHGRLDLGSPAAAAWELARAWPDAELYLVATGHAGGDEMTERLIAATDRFAR